MHLLVSFCNLRAEALPRLGLLDAGSMEFRVLRLPPGVPTISSVTGLAMSPRYVFVAVQEHPPQGVQVRGYSSVLVFDPKDFSLVDRHVIQSASDVHSLWASADSLLAVSTGTDQVLELKLRDSEVLSETVIWQPEQHDAAEDAHHLNSLIRFRDELIVAGFGKNAPQGGGGQNARSGWNDTRDGFIYNITARRVITSGLSHPHSLADLDGALALCESQRMSARTLDGGRACMLPGYTRGLCVADGALFVATSIGRRVSKSTGRINNPSHPGVRDGRCTISRLTLGTFEIEQQIDLSDCGQEVYDLLAVQDTSGWPVVSDNRWRSDAVRGLLAVVDLQVATVKRHAQELNGKTAEVDRLKAQVEGQTSEARRLSAVLAQRERDIQRMRRRLGRAERAARHIAMLRRDLRRQGQEFLRLAEGAAKECATREGARGGAAPMARLAEPIEVFAALVTEWNSKIEQLRSRFLRASGRANEGQARSNQAETGSPATYEAAFHAVVIQLCDQVLRGLDMIRPAASRSKAVAASGELKSSVGTPAAAPPSSGDDEAYPRLLSHVRDAVGYVTPRDATVLVVSKGDDALLDLHGRRAEHFPQGEDGGYAGYHPADSADAIRHLKDLRRRGGHYLVFPATAFWWFDHYREFCQYLDTSFRRVSEDRWCVVYDLRAMPPPALMRSNGGGRRKVAVPVSEITHNPTGRAYLPAGMLSRRYEVSLAGANFPQDGSAVWDKDFQGSLFRDHFVAMEHVAAGLDADAVVVSKTPVAVVRAGDAHIPDHGGHLGRSRAAAGSK